MGKQAHVCVCVCMRGLGCSMRHEMNAVLCGHLIWRYTVYGFMTAADWREAD